MKKVKEWILPIKTVSELNSCEHWSKKYQRRKNQGYIIFYEWKNDPPSLSFPIHIVLTRLSTRMLDVGDNLPSAFKAIRDMLANLIFPGLPSGQADSDDRITWEYKQEKAKGYNVKIQIYLADKTLDC